MLALWCLNSEILSSLGAFFFFFFNFPDVNFLISYFWHSKPYVNMISDLVRLIKYLLIISKKVKVTIKLVPQLNTVAMAIARPLTAAGNISLSTSQVTENIST